MKTLSFGEVLWDIIEGEAHLGGAPFNVAAHLAQLGCESAMISRVGKDELGDRALTEAKRLGVDTSLIQRDPDHATGTVDVSLDSKGVPTFVINEGVAYDFIGTSPDLLSHVAAGELDVFAFGTLIQRAEAARAALHRILDALKAEHVFYDVNLRQHYFSKEIIETSLACSTIVKLNDEEAAQLGEVVFGTTMAEEEFAARVCDRFGVQIVCVTRGERGCTVYHEGRREDCPGVKVEVADTVGSGDAFSAAFLYKYRTGSPPGESAELANRIGGFVASRRGAILEYTDEIRALLGN